MTVFLNDWQEAPNGPIWLSIGNFDGVHLGHQALIRQLKSLAAEERTVAGVLTFNPHPRLLFNPNTAPFLLDSAHEKCLHLMELDPDLVLELPFDQGLASMDAEAFIELLVNKLHMRGLIVGSGFALGHERRGNTAQLRALCAARKIRFEEFGAVSLDGQRVSSGQIRQAVNTGRMDSAAKLLGRPYTVIGPVREGKRLGSRLGFPTANQIVDASKLLPRYGVYASWAVLEGKRYKGVTGVGVRPTVEICGKPNVETWILDFDGNIYGEVLQVDFMEYLREEKKFESVEAMISQIKNDALHAREVLNDA
jgi:riboflavin kinase/FMN adenylyltransferase